jgi:hypothetical protein
MKKKKYNAIKDFFKLEKRTYSVTEFFYDTSFKDYIKLYPRNILSFVDLYPNIQSIHAIEPRIQEMQSIGNMRRIDFYNDVNNERSQIVLQKMMEFIKDNNAIVTASQLESRMSDSDIKF